MPTRSSRASRGSRRTTGRASSASAATSTRSRRAALSGPRPTGLTIDDVIEIGLTLPNTAAATAWGSPSLEVNGNRFCALAINKAAEPNSLGLHCDFETRDAMIAEQPDLYYTASHYENYPCVLVRLSRVSRDVLEDLLRMSHRFVSSKPGKGRATKARRATKR